MVLKEFAVSGVSGICTLGQLRGGTGSRDQCLLDGSGENTAILGYVKRLA